MSQSDELGFRAKKEIQNISFAFGSILQLSDNGDIGSAVLLAQRLMKRLVDLLIELQASNEYTKAYLDVIISTRMPNLQADRATLDSFTESIPAPDSQIKNLRQTIRRLEDYIRITKREVRVLFPHEFEIRQLIRDGWHRHRAAFSFGAFLLLGLCVSYFSWNFYYVNKHSLLGEYFNDTELKSLYRTRRDPNIDFAWGYGSPFLGFKADQFSVRWTGFLEVKEDGVYDFQTESDDGVILWIDDKKIIENWTPHAIQKDGASIYLTAGLHPIKMHYFEFDANAEIRLFWKKESEKNFTTVPQASFFSKN